MSSQSRVFVLILLLCTSLLLSCLENGEALEGPPSIKFDKFVHDYGKLTQGDKVHYTFKFQNVGGDALVIAKIRKSCGCTTARATVKTLKPGQSAGIEIEFNTKGIRGNVRKRVYVHSNDPEQSVVTLELKGVVVVDYIVRPLRLHYGRIYVGQSVTKNIWLLPLEKKDLVIENIESPSEYASVETTERIGKDGREIGLSVTLTPQGQFGVKTPVIKVFTNSKLQPVIDIPIYAKIVE